MLPSRSGWARRRCGRAPSAPASALRSRWPAGRYRRAWSPSRWSVSLHLQARVEDVSPPVARRFMASNVSHDAQAGEHLPFDEQFTSTIGPSLYFPPPRDSPVEGATSRLREPAGGVDSDCFIGAPRGGTAFPS